MSVPPLKGALPRSRRGGVIGGIPPGVCGVLFAVVVVYAWAVVVHGSPGNAWAYSRGKRVVINDPVLIVPAEREFHAMALTVRNLSSTPVRILGTDKSCGRVSTEPFPVDIPANGSRAIRLTARGSAHQNGTWLEIVPRLPC